MRGGREPDEVVEDVVAEVKDVEARSAGDEQAPGRPVHVELANFTRLVFGCIFRGV